MEEKRAKVLALSEDADPYEVMREYQLYGEALEASATKSGWQLVEAQSSPSGLFDTEHKFLTDPHELKALFYTEDWVYIVADLIALKISAQRMQVMRKVVRDGEETAEYADYHPLNKQLDQPNDNQDYHAFMYWLVVDLILTGNATVYKGLTGSTLQPLPIENMRLDLDKDGTLNRYMVVGCAYGEWYDTGRSFTKDEIIHVRRPHPSSTLWGLSPFMAGSKAIAFNRYSSEYLNNFYLKGAQPGIAIELGDNANEKNALRMLRSFEAAYSGRRNQRRTLVAPRGTTIKQMSHSLADQQLKDYINQNRETILGLLKVPKHEVGLQTAGSLGSEEHKTALANFWSATLIPTSRLIEGAFNKAFSRQLGDEYYFEFDLSDVDALSESRAETARSAESLLKTHTLNEVRSAVYGLPPIDGGDTVIGMQQPINLPIFPGGQDVPRETVTDKPIADEAVENQVTSQTQALNGAQIDSLVTLVQQVAAGTLPRDSAINIIRIGFAVSLEEAESMLGSAGAGFSIAPTESTKPTAPATVTESTAAVEVKADIDAVIEKQNAVATRFMKANSDWVEVGQERIQKEEEKTAPKIGAVFLSLLDAQTLAAVKEIKKADKKLPSITELRKRIARVLNADNLQTEWTKNGVKFLEPSMEVGHGVGLTFPFKVPDQDQLDALSAKDKKNRRKILEARLIETFKNTTQTTTEKMMAVIEEGIANGESVNKISQTLVEKFSEKVPDIQRRADTIARTETATATSIGRAAAVKVASEVIPNLKKIWLNVGDSRVRGNPGGEYPDAAHDHWRLHGQVRNHDEDFEDPRSGERLSFPRDPKGAAGATINCRCDMVALPAEDMDQYQEDVQ